MSKFRNLIESIILNETVLRCDIPPRFEDMFNDLTFHNKVNILKNPSENELKLFLNNSKIGQLRSIGIGNDKYYIDAFIAMHCNLAEILRYNGYIEEDSDNYSIDFISLDDFDYSSEENATKDIGGLYQIYRDIESLRDLNVYMDICPKTIQYFLNVYTTEDLLSPNKDGINQFLTKIQSIK